MKNILITLAVLFILIWVGTSCFCFYKINNNKYEISLILEKGSDPKELSDFVNDLKKAYPSIIVKKVFNEEESFKFAAEQNNIKPEDLDNYRKITSGSISAEINFKVSKNDLVSENEFKNFISNKFIQYKTLKLDVSSGRGGDRIASFFDSASGNLGFCLIPKYSISGMYNYLVYYTSI